MLPAAVKFSRLFFPAGLALLLVFLPAKAFTNSTWFTRVWQIDDGLLDNNVNGIVQGPDHYLWLVTPVGLMQFDGSTFYPFPAEHFTGTVAASHIRILLQSRSGVLWMASDGGTVTELRPDFSTTQFSRGLPRRVPGSLAEDRNGALWLAYPAGIYRLENGKVAKVTAIFPAGSFQSLTSDGAGNIWLAKGNQVGFFENGQFHVVARPPGSPPYLAATLTNAIWIAAGNRLFWCGQNGTIRDCGAFQSASSPATLALLEDHSGGVWIGTDGNGLFRYDQSHFERIETSHSSILSLAEDDEGDIWAGTGGGGLDRITRSGVQLDILENNDVQAQIQSVCQDSNGVLWGATRNGDLLARMGDHWERAFTNAPFAGTVTCVAADRGAIWIGTRNGRLAKLENAHCSVWETNLAQDAITGLLSTSAGNLWIVEGGALERMHDGIFEKVRLPRQVARIFSIAEDADGNVWVGANGLLLRFNGTNMVNETSRLRIAGRPICCLCGTSDGSMWVGSRGGGLMWFKKDQASRIGLNQGLGNNYISQIIADERGWLWFASTRGIFKIRQSEVEQAMENHNAIVRPIVYGQNEGLASQEAIFSTTPPFVLPRPIDTRDGRIWMLMHTGIVVADPAILPDDPAPPPVALTQVVLDKQIIASRDGVGTTQMVAALGTLTGPLQIPPSHRYLEFNFTAFHFQAPENVRFRYQLAGFDNGWIDAGPQRTATYSRLTSGNYQFRVEAAVGDGPWSDSAAALAFTVDPFFWETWWFRAGLLLLFTSSVIVVVRYVSIRRMRMQMALVEQRAALDKERTRIARDLHDDLGCSLNKVALTLDMMQGDSSRSDSDAGEIRHCSSMIRNVAQSVDEIVWAINPRNDTLLYLVDYISQSAVEFLEAAGISCIVEMPDNLPKRSVPPEVRHNLLLVVKEALNNIGRHACASEVQLHITVSEDQMVIVLRDNGRGFERAPDNSSCDGLRNMRQRMEEIKGRFQIESRPGAGTRVEFQYAWGSKS